VRAHVFQPYQEPFLTSCLLSQVGSLRGQEAAMHRRPSVAQRRRICGAAPISRRSACLGRQSASKQEDVPRLTPAAVLLTHLLSVQVNPLIASGQVWRLLTPALLHGGLMHLFVNCYSLNDLGPAAERLLGPRKFTALYIASAISGNVASFYFSPAPGVGASGAIFGLVGCLAVYFARHRHLYGRMGELKLECVHPAAIRHCCMRTLLTHCTSFRALMRVIVMNLGLGAMSRTIDNWAHVGGLVGGAALTFTCGPNLVWEGGRLVDRPLVRLQL